MTGVSDRTLLQPPVNVLRLSLHPGGLAPAILNLRTWRAHLLARLRRDALATGDPVLLPMLRELSAPADGVEVDAHPGTGVAVPLELGTAVGPLSLISTTTVFGTPTEVTLAELAIEAFYPADPATAVRLAELQARVPAKAG